MGRRSIPTSTHQLAKKLGLSHNAVHLALRGKPGLSDETRRRILRESGREDPAPTKGNWLFLCRSGTEKDSLRMHLEAFLTEHSFLAETRFVKNFSTTSDADFEAKRSGPKTCLFFFGFENAALPTKIAFPSIVFGSPENYFLNGDLGSQVDFIDTSVSKKTDLPDASQWDQVAAFLKDRESRPDGESRVLRLGRLSHSSESSKKKKATLADIAHRSGVTANTVSRALHRKPDVGPEISRRVFRNAQALGYSKIPPLREAIVLIFRQIPSPQTGPLRIESWQLAELAGEQGFSLHVYEAISKPLSLDPDLPVLRESIKRLEPDAILSFPFTRDFLEKTREVAAPLGLPVLSFQVSGEASGLDSVFIDNRIGVERHLRHCLDLGIRRNIGYVSTWRPEAFAEQERFAFFKKCLSRLGVTRNEAWEILVPLEWDLRWPRPENRPAIFYDPHFFQKQIRKRISENVAAGLPLPGALLCYNDLAASLLLKSFLELGIAAPKILGWDADDALLSTLEADIPTIAIPSDEMTRSFVSLLLRRLRSPLAPALSLSFAGKFHPSIRKP